MTTIIDIENMSAADIKAKKAELVEAVKGEESLAARYVQARTDAKVRDEKLQEQGQTITELHASLSTARSEIKSLSGAVAVADRNKDVATKQIAELTEALKDCQAKCERLKLQATKNASAVSTAYKILSDAMSAQAIDAAEQG